MLKLLFEKRMVWLENILEEYLLNYKCCIIKKIKNLNLCLGKFNK